MRIVSCTILAIVLGATLQLNGRRRFAHADTVKIDVREREQRDLSDLVVVTLEEREQKRRAEITTQQVTVRNISDRPIEGPLWLVIDGLTAGVTLVNADGTVGCATSPFVRLDLHRGGQPNVLRPDHKTKATLEFRNPERRPIAFTTRVIRGE